MTEAFDASLTRHSSTAALLRQFHGIPLFDTTPRSHEWHESCTVFETQPQWTTTTEQNGGMVFNTNFRRI